MDRQVTVTQAGYLVPYQDLPLLRAVEIKLLHDQRAFWTRTVRLLLFSYLLLEFKDGLLWLKPCGVASESSFSVDISI